MLCHVLGWCYALADVIASFMMGDVMLYGQMLLSMFYHLADVIAFSNDVVVSMTLHFMLVWYWQILLPSGKDGTATFILKDGRCYCHVADGMATVYFFVGRCYSQVAEGITTQSGLMVLGRCYNQVGRWNSHGVCFSMLILVLRCYAEPHPRYVANGTCLCFCSGMDYWP